MRTDRPAWAVDDCPPTPLVRRGDLALPAGMPLPLTRLVADMHVTGAAVTPAVRAVAVAFCTPLRHAVFVRATAMWIWTGEEAIMPTHVEFAEPPHGPPLPGPTRLPPERSLPLRQVQAAGLTWTTLAGVALTDPQNTALDCARLMPRDLARRCLNSLVAALGLDASALYRLLLASPGQPGRVQGVQILADLAGQSGTTVRATPVVTR